MKTPTRNSKAWSYFLLWMGVDALLSWLPLGVWERFWLFPLALLVQLAWAFWPAPAAPPKEKGPFQLEIMPVPFWSWMVLLFGLAAFFRLYHLVSLPVWPTWDDANYSYFAISQAEHWRWDLLIGHEKTMPLFTWVQALWFKLTGPSLFSMWLYTSLLSLATVPLAYWASRRFFSRSFSFLYAWLWAFTFWPLYYGKFCAYLGVFQWVTGLLLLGAAGTLCKKFPKRSLLLAFLLGLAAGASLYSSMLFLIPIALLALMFLVKTLREQRSLAPIILYSLTFTLASSPMLLGLFQNLLGGHISTYLTLKDQGTPLLPHLMTELSYLTAFFFGPIDKSYFAFAPLWGGFLNPILDAFFFIGLKQTVRFRRESLVLMGAVCLLGIFLPLSLFSTLECFRTDLALLFFFVLIAIGVMTLVETLDKNRRALFLVGMAVLSLAPDLYHYFGIFHDWSTAMPAKTVVKSPERFRAYQILNGIQQTQGPGLVMEDFVADPFDQSLLVSTYPFNAARNPRLDPAQARWAALLVDAHYQKALTERFAQGHFYGLTDPQNNDGTFLLLDLIPITSPEESKLFQEWTTIHQELQDLHGLMPYVVKNPDFHPILERLYLLYPRVAQDPLLKAWVLERVLNTLLVADDLSDSFWFLDRPVQYYRSYAFLDGKFALLYHKLGMGLMKKGDLGQARESFKRAARFDPKYDLKKALALCDKTK